jgi:hypothetical protein
MSIVFHITTDAPDDQISFVTKADHLQRLAFDLLKEFSPKNVRNCIRFFGNLFALDE